MTRQGTSVETPTPKAVPHTCFLLHEFEAAALTCLALNVEHIDALANRCSVEVRLNGILCTSELGNLCTCHADNINGNDLVGSNVINACEVAAVLANRI